MDVTALMNLILQLAVTQNAIPLLAMTTGVFIYVFIGERNVSKNLRKVIERKDELINAERDRYNDLIERYHNNQITLIELGREVLETYRATHDANYK